MNVILLLLLSVDFSFAASEEKEAERVRISGDMDRFSKRGNWKAVEKKYKEILGLGLDIPFEDHLLGAQAAFNLGKVKQTCLILERAIELAADSSELAEAKASAESWLSEIYSTFFPVELSISKSFDGPRDLQISELPFMPEEQDAYNKAKKTLEEQGTFKGMLPVGEYMLGGQSFVVPTAAMTSGVPNEAYKLKLQNPGAEFSVAPRLDIGSAFAKAGELKETSSINADSFGGIGARAGAGIELGLGQKIGIFTEVGYHGLSNKEDLPKELSQLYGFEQTPTSYQSFFIWGGARYKMGPTSFLLGTTIDKASATTQGADKKSDPRLDAATAQYLPLEGEIVAVGLSGGVSYALMNVGPLQGGLSMIFGAQNDSARWYSWGQLALTFSPS